MRARLGLIGCALAVFGAGLLAAGCKDARYCDANTPCTDPAYPYCRQDLRECEATPADGGMDAAGDGARADGARDGAGTHDGADAGCESPLRACGDGCYPLDDINHCGASCEACVPPTNGHPTCDGTACGFECDLGHWKDGTGCSDCDTTAHCGPSCGACSGGTPECQGGITGGCVCNGTSCSGTTPVCDATTHACRACTAHDECASGACDLAGGGCVAEGDVIYLDKNNASCIDTGSGAGSVTTPFCSFDKAVDAVTLTRWRIVAAPAGYSVDSAILVQDKKVLIIGSDTGSTEISQITGSVPVFDIRGTADVTLYRLTVKGTGTDGVLCNGLTSTAQLSLERCTVGPNLGRGINATQCTVTLTQSTLRDNAGVGIGANSSTVAVGQTIVMQNAGGGISVSNSDYTIENCLIVGNGTGGGSGSSTGGVSLNNPGSTAVFINNTVVGNYVKSGATSGGVWCVGGGTVVNSILWGNEVAQQKDCDVTYSDVQGGLNATGNINADPLFVNSGAGDYHLTSPGSLCIGAGTATGAPLVDLDGNPRSSTPDLGCYEAQ